MHTLFGLFHLITYVNQCFLGTLQDITIVQLRQPNKLVMTFYFHSVEPVQS